MNIAENLDLFCVEPTFQLELLDTGAMWPQVEMVYSVVLQPNNSKKSEKNYYRI